MGLHGMESGTGFIIDLRSLTISISLQFKQREILIKGVNMLNHTNIKTICLTGLLLLAASGCAPKTFRLNNSKHTIVPLTELVKNSEKYTKLFESRKPVVVSVKKGQKIPVNLILDTKIVSMETKDMLTVVRDMCIFISKKGVALSPDCKTFANMQNGKSVWKLFKLGKGSTSVGLSINKTGLSMPITVRQR
jgi:ABC-type Fe3+-hydroxamate transport system substrate-binding protein